MYIRFIISKLLICLALTLTFISCSVELYILAPYNEGIMYEYQFRNGRYELKVTFSRNKKTGQLRSIRFETNGQFVKKTDDNGNDNKDNIFVVDPKTADIRLGEKTLKLGKCTNPPYEGCINIEKQEMSIVINNKEIKEKEKGTVLRIFPSDFVTNKGRRVINDTIFLKLWSD